MEFFLGLLLVIWHPLPISSVFVKTMACPSTKYSWDKRDKDVCSNITHSTYHCVLNGFDELHETCIRRRLFRNKDGCPWIDKTSSGVIWGTHFTVCNITGCPSSEVEYYSNELYKYPLCLVPTKQRNELRETSLNKKGNWNMPMHHLNRPLKNDTHPSTYTESSGITTEDPEFHMSWKFLTLLISTIVSMIILIVILLKIASLQDSMKNYDKCYYQIFWKCLFCISGCPSVKNSKVEISDDTNAQRDIESNGSRELTTFP